jgi:hypothetical protein
MPESVYTVDASDSQITIGVGQIPNRVDEGVRPGPIATAKIRRRNDSPKRQLELTSQSFADQPLVNLRVSITIATMTPSICSVTETERVRVLQ